MISFPRLICRYIFKEECPRAVDHYLNISLFCIVSSICCCVVTEALESHHPRTVSHRKYTFCFIFNGDWFKVCTCHIYLGNRSLLTLSCHSNPTGIQPLTYFEIDRGQSLQRDKHNCISSKECLRRSFKSQPPRGVLIPGGPSFKNQCFGTNFVSKKTAGDQ